ncbi:MAG: hypothetical protein ACLSE7_05660 [Lachnospirales bacterium]|jgi:tRNA A58 N-methylase Trm61
MKFKGIVIGILTAIFALNAVMAGVLITEAKKQTRLQIAQANLIIAYGDYQNGWTHNMGDWREAVQNEEKRILEIRNEDWDKRLKEMGE